MNHRFLPLKLKATVPSTLALAGLFAASLTFPASAIESAIESASATPALDDKQCISEHCQQQFKRLRKYARYGNPKAQLLVANAYLTGDGLASDLTMAVRYLNKARINGSIAAGYILADLYRQGVGVEQDTARADSLVNTAVKHNYGPALYAKARQTLNLESTENDKEIKLLEIAALGHHKPSAYLLAQMYEYGEGVAQDSYQAAKYFNYLSRSGYKDSQQRFTALLKQSKASSKSASSPALYQQIASLQNDIEVIGITAKKLSFDKKLDITYTKIKQNENYQGIATGSRIAGANCRKSSYRCGAVDNSHDIDTLFSR
ncbi:MAG: TPR repeat protein [Phenylobacterium sp.]|jgi:TPR repeat protein